MLFAGNPSVASWHPHFEVFADPRDEDDERDPDGLPAEDESRIPQWAFRHVWPRIAGGRWTEDPSTGTVGWESMRATYEIGSGSTNHTITDGSTTARYVSWDARNPTVFTGTNFNPRLKGDSNDDVHVVAINDGGRVRLMLDSTDSFPPDKGIAFWVHVATVTSITSAGWTQVTGWGQRNLLASGTDTTKSLGGFTEDGVSYGFSLSSSKFTAPRSGYYRFGGVLEVGAVPDQAGVQTRLSGTFDGSPVYGVLARQSAGSSVALSTPIPSHVIWLERGDTVQLDALMFGSTPHDTTTLTGWSGEYCGGG